MMSLIRPMLRTRILSGGCTTTYAQVDFSGIWDVSSLPSGSTILMYLSRCTGSYSATRTYGIKLSDSVQLVMNVLNDEVTSLVTTSRDSEATLYTSCGRDGVCTIILLLTT